MINFEEEIAKFQPSLEVEQAEDVIQNNDLADITDLIKSMIKELKINKRYKLKDLTRKCLFDYRYHRN
jgi:hypothetical protein